MGTDEEFMLKICAIGSVSAQKTEFIRRYADEKFDTDYLPTQGADITNKKITVNNEPVKLILVDTAGQEFFRKLRSSYYRGASVVIIFFSKGDRKSFEEVPEWKKEFEEHIAPPLPSVILGLQAETEEVTTKEAKQLAKRLGATYFECHPKLEGEKVAAVFHSLAQQVINEG